MSEEEIILELAKKYLNGEDQKIVKERVERNELPMARLRVLSVLDNLHTEEKVTADEMNDAFQKLGIGPPMEPAMVKTFVRRRY